MNYTIEKVTTLIGARRFGNAEASIGFLLTDSRSLCFPEETLFFALKSERNDGHKYIDDLYRRGVRNFVVEQLPEKWEERYPNSNFLKVVGTLEALQRLAGATATSSIFPSSESRALTARPWSRSGSISFSLRQWSSHGRREATTRRWECR